MTLPPNAADYAIDGLALRALTTRDVDEMLRLQDDMLAALPNARWYYPSERWEFEAGVRDADSFGYFDGEALAGFAMITAADRRAERGYARKLGEPPEETYDFHDVMVTPAYRRRGIHSSFLRLFADMARAEGGRAVYATVDPENGASCRNFERAGYLCIKTTPAYDGRVRRYYRLALRP